MAISARFVKSSPILLLVLFCMWLLPTAAAHAQLTMPDVVINELLASNDNYYLDEDGDDSDWVELRNMSDSAVSLSGWYLTDDPQDLRKWQFPAGMADLAPGAYLVIFASDKNRAVAGSELHTNFKLAASGEYLALVRPDGVTVEHEYAPDYPAQFENISYGLGTDGIPMELVSDTAACKYLVPTSSSFNPFSDWLTASTSGWADGYFGIGYDNATTYDPYLDDLVDQVLSSTMYNQNTTVLVKTTFSLANPASLMTLTLRMRYDDTFVAYLNGVRVCDGGYLPAGDLAWNSDATGGRSDSLAVQWVDYDLSAYIPLLVNGDNTLAFHGINNGSSSSDMLLQPQLNGVADSGEAIDYRYFEVPTPGTANASGKLGFVAPVEADYPHGYYTAPITVNLVCDTADAEIRYTTDCTVPTETTGTLYTGPITIGQSTIIRAMAFKSGYDDSPSVTISYIFPADVLGQGNDQTARGFPTQWIADAGGSGIYDRRYRTADYEMDPNIVGAPAYAPLMNDALYDLPVLSLVGTMYDLFDRYNGIYPNSIQRASADIKWEKAANLEMFMPDGSGEEFSINCGMRITGELARWAAVNDKQSFRIVFKSDYGPSKLKTDFFNDPDVDEYDTFIIRAHWGQSFLNDEVRGDQIGVSFANGDPTRTTYIRDIYGHDTFRATGQTAPRGRFAHLFLNGIYWGLYEIIERPDNSFHQEHFGGDKDSYDVIKGGVGADDTNGFLQDGDRQAYNKLMSYFNASASSGQNYTSVTPTSDAAMIQIEQYMDVDNFIDYMVTLWHICRLDFPRKNWYCVGRHDPADPDGVPLERFRFYTWDSEASMWATDSSAQADRWNATDTSNDTGPVRIYRRMRQNAAFQRRWADRVQELMFNDGPMTPENAIARFQARREEINLGVICESARWGDWAYLHHDDPMTRDGQWAAECDRIENDYLANRREYVLAQMAAVDLWPGFLAPVFSQHGGSVPEDYELTMTNPNGSGTIYYTLDGSDPRESASAMLYTLPIPLGTVGFVEVKACVLLGGEWSALNHAGFTTFGADGLVVSEIMYNPPAGGEAGGIFPEDDYEFIELLNNTSSMIDLEGMTLSGDVQFTFPAATFIQPGQRFLIGSSYPALVERYGVTVAAALTYTGNLGNGGGTVTLSAPNGAILFTVTYNDGGDWPGRADGTGSSLELKDPSLNPADPDSWRNSAEYLGTPGAEGAGSLNDVVVNEVLAHTDEPLMDFIELRNTTASAIDISGWYLSDSASMLKKFKIPNGTSIPANGRIVFDEADFNLSGLDADPNNDLPTDFSLNSAHGDDVWVVEADETDTLIRFVDHAEFGATANGESLGLWPDGTIEGKLYPMLYPTAGLPNAGPRVGPLLISEIAYNIEDNEDLEFIEILNPTNDDVPLAGWALGGGIDYDFAVTDILEAGQRLIVIPFNPANPVNIPRLTAFATYYGLDGSVIIVGGYGGNLSNGGERVTLYRPDDPPMEEPYYTPLLIEDTVRYNDAAPWPLSADGLGDSLHRVLPAGLGDNAASWQADEPSPGAAGGQPMTPGDANGDGSVDIQDFVILKQNYGQPGDRSRGDFNGDGNVDIQDFVILKQNYGTGAN